MADLRERLSDQQIEVMIETLRGELEYAAVHAALSQLHAEVAALRPSSDRLQESAESVSRRLAENLQLTEHQRQEVASALLDFGPVRASAPFINTEHAAAFASPGVPAAQYHEIPREQDGPIRIVLEMRSAAHHDRSMNACTRSALAGWADRLSEWFSREPAAPSAGPATAERKPCAAYLDAWRVGNDWLKVPAGAVCPRCGFYEHEHGAGPAPTEDK